MTRKIVQALAWDNEYDQLVEFRHSAMGTNGYWFSRNHVPPYNYGWQSVYWSNYLSVAQVLRRKRYTILYTQTGDAA